MAVFLMMILQWIFWITFTIIVYHYFGFPLLTIISAKLINQKIDKKTIYPSVSLIIAAYNEEKIIEAKIKNSFELDYPTNKLEIIVVSDGSTDSTPHIVGKYKDQGVISLFNLPRMGKTSALNRAVTSAQGEIVIFSDANSMYEPSAITHLVANFNDPSIGGVCGRKSIVINAQRESSVGDSLFWEFESTIKTMQSRAGSITNGDGEIFALRRHLYEEIPEYIINDDQAITINIVKNGYRVVYEPTAVSYEEASIVIEDDFKVKARMVAGGYQTIARYKNVLLPPTDLFSLQFFSHKMIRYVMPLLLIALLIGNLFLLKGILLYFCCVQLFFYALAILGYLLKMAGRTPGFCYLPFYYCSMNIAALYGFYYFLVNKDAVSVWQKASR